MPAPELHPHVGVMSNHVKPRPPLGLIHAIFLGAAAAVFLFILLWSGEASGYLPPQGASLIQLITNTSDIRSTDAFWQGAGSAALAGAVIGALIMFCADGLSRARRP